MSTKQAHSCWTFSLSVDTILATKPHTWTNRTLVARVVTETPICSRVCSTQIWMSFSLLAAPGDGAATFALHVITDVSFSLQQGSSTGEDLHRTPDSTVVRLIAGGSNWKLENCIPAHDRWYDQLSRNAPRTMHMRPTESSAHATHRKSTNEPDRMICNASIRTDRVNQRSWTTTAKWCGDEGAGNAAYFRVIRRCDVAMQLWCQCS